MCDNGSTLDDPSDALRGRSGAVDVRLLDRALAHVSRHPLEWDQSVAPGLERPTLVGTARSFLGHALHLSGIEAPVLARSSGSVWLDSSHALTVMADVTGADEDDLEVFVHPRARLGDLAKSIDWIRVGLSTEALIDEIEGREPGARSEPAGPLGGTDLVQLLLLDGIEPDLADDLGGDLADRLGELPVAAWFGHAGTPDILLLEHALAFVAEHPLQWDQSTWQSDGLFGPVRCVGGHALVMSGYLIDPLDPEQATSPDGIVGTSRRHAMTRLGLTEDDASELLSLSDLETLTELLQDIEAEAAEQLRSGLG